jgi:hypothetical protein
MFENLKIDDDVKSGGDVLGGGSKFQAVDSGIYECTIKLAYQTVSRGGAAGVSVLLETEDGAEVKQTLWVTSKTGNVFYLAKNPKTGKKDVKTFLAGFENANHMCMLTLGKKLTQVETEENTIMLYDYAQGSEVPTPVKMIKGIVGKKIMVGIIKQKENKKMQDSEGNWIALTDTRESNEISKFFQVNTGLTCTELAAEETEATFKTQWEEKWTGVTKDKTSSDAIADPRKEDAGTTTPKKSLFGGASE